MASRYGRQGRARGKEATSKGPLVHDRVYLKCPRTPTSVETESRSVPGAEGTEEWGVGQMGTGLLFRMM